MAAKRKKVTLNEFRAWLEGVEELQPDNWSPSNDQWKLIRAKIDNIKEDQVNEGTSIPRGTKTIQSTIPGILPAPPVGGIPPANVVTMSNEAKSLLEKSPDGKTKTPDIDTTDGQFKSSFT